MHITHLYGMQNLINAQTSPIHVRASWTCGNLIADNQISCQCVHASCVPDVWEYCLLNLLFVIYRTGLVLINFNYILHFNYILFQNTLYKKDD